MKTSMSNRLMLLGKAFLTVVMSVAVLTSSQKLNAQTAYKAPGADVKVLGTSNLHDWKMKAENPSATAQFTVANGITAINALNFTVNVKNLKSGESLMDSRAYNTLNADKYTTITFNLTSGEVVKQGNGYVIKANGNLTISGVSRPVTLVANGVLNGDKTITVSGAQKIKMSDYKVKPPSFMMGMLKVADEVTVQYNLKFNG